MNVTGAVGPQVNAARAAAVVQLLGREKMEEMIDLLSQRLSSLADKSSPPTSSAAIRVIHQSQGSAASLGLHGLHRALHDLEQCLAAGDDLAIGREIGSISHLLATERALLDAVTR